MAENKRQDNILFCLNKFFGFFHPNSERDWREESKRIIRADLEFMEFYNSSGYELFKPQLISQPFDSYDWIFFMADSINNPNFEETPEGKNNLNYFLTKNIIRHCTETFSHNRVYLLIMRKAKFFLAMKSQGYLHKVTKTKTLDFQHYLQQNNYYSFYYQ